MICVTFASGSNLKHINRDIASNRAMLATIQSETEHIKKSTQDAQTHISNLNDPRTIEQEARRYEWVLPGEHRIRLPR